MNILLHISLSVKQYENSMSGLYFPLSEFVYINVYNLVRLWNILSVLLKH